MKYILTLILSITLVAYSLDASEDFPTQEEVAKLYVATFNRAPDADGLAYWTNDLGLKLSQIAQSFFDQEETQVLYPTETLNRSFIQSVYANLFNRKPDIDGWNYWENELTSGAFSRNSFIMAVIGGALDNEDGLDKTILDNKTTVGLYFANQGLTGLDKAKTVMQDITSDTSSVSRAQELSKLYASVDAVVNLNSNFSQENIFSADILYPKGIFKDKYDNIYTYSSTNSGSTIAKLTNDNKLELVVKTDKKISGLAYQASEERFILTTELSSLYTLDIQGNTTMLKLFGVVGNKIITASDDTFYTCTGANGFGVIHYDKNGNKLEEIASNINICSSIALNINETKLYYTSSYDGTVNEVDLQSKVVTTIASNLGIPGTYEPITLAFDDNDNLYSIPAANGLHKYENGQFNQVIESVSGAGDIIYSKKHNSFLISAGASANLVAYNTQTLTGDNLTDYLNAFTVVQTNSGKVLACNNNMNIEKIDVSGFSTYMNLKKDCAHLVTDNNGVVYVGTADGEILKIDESTLSSESFASFTSMGIVHITYDSLNNAFISLHNINNTSVEIWKTPLDNPSSASKLYTLTNVTVNNNVPVAASDNNGNTYILERSNNKIYKLNIATAQLSDFFEAPLNSEAITVPDMIYLSSEDALLISTIEDYQIIPIQTKVKSTFAINNGSVDNFSMHVNSNGEIVSVHSGQVFKMNKAK